MIEYKALQTQLFETIQEKNKIRSDFVRVQADLQTVINLIENRFPLKFNVPKQYGQS